MGERNAKSGTRKELFFVCSTAVAALSENSFSFSSSPPLFFPPALTCDLLSDLAPLGEHVGVLSVGLGGGHCEFSGFEGGREENENEAFRE